jgi:hypothetical protein
VRLVALLLNMPRSCRTDADHSAISSISYNTGSHVPVGTSDANSRDASPMIPGTICCILDKSNLVDWVTLS